MITKDLWQLPGMKRISLVLLGLACGQAAAIIAQTSFLALALAGIWAGEGLSAQKARIVFFLLAFLLRQALKWRREKLLADYAGAVTKTLRRCLLEKTFVLGPNFAQKQGTGNLATLALEGISRIEDYLLLFLPKMAGVLIIPLFILLYTVFLDGRSALIMLLVLPVILVFMTILGRAARSRADKQYQRYRLLANHFVDSLRGLETLKLLGRSHSHGQAVGRVSEEYRRATMSTLAVGMMSGFTLDFFSTLSIAVIALFLGLRLLEGTLILAPALQVLLLAPEYFLPLREFAGDYHATLEGKKALEAVQGVLAEPEASETPTVEKICPWSAASCLVVRDVTVAGDRQGDKRLAKLSFAWQGFGKIGIVGASGAGKSTLIEVLGGFLQPEAGRIQVGDVLVPHLRQQAWQKQLLYIPQHPYIFQGTLADNIRFYTPGASEQEVRQAAGQAGLDEVIAELPLGLREVIGEGGRILSGGQEQRVVLARAFLAAERKILLFDEPTAHIDLETEYELKRTMLPLMESRLVFFATHRLHWLSEMDWTLLVDKGRIVAQGPPEELRKTEAYQVLLQARRGRNAPAFFGGGNPSPEEVGGDV